MVPSWISIHALLAESDYLINTYHRIFGISIHALLAESDRLPTALRTPHHNFYPRSPCGERPAPRAGLTCGGGNFYPRSPCGERQRAENHASSQQEFLSTLSLRRATRAKSGQRRSPGNFYPRSPCGERQTTTGVHGLNPLISIHALLAESDAARSRCHPVGGDISIHALLAESDSELNSSWISSIKFLSTLSLRRATESSKDTNNSSDHFYPRSPCGERPCTILCLFGISAISIHALLAESDPGKIWSTAFAW